MAHATSDSAVSIGIESLRKIGKACGVTGALTDPSTQLLGKIVSAELIEGDNGYLEIKDNSFEPANSKTEETKTETASSSANEDDVPF